MKQYVIDELRFEDYEKVKTYMDKNYGFSKIDGIYWIPIGKDILSEIQENHVQCQPFYFAVDLEPSRMACELLVRTKDNVRCNCINYATEKQLNWFIQLMDAIFEKIGVMV
jgi:hypothetical protein